MHICVAFFPEKILRVCYNRSARNGTAAVNVLNNVIYIEDMLGPEKCLLWPKGSFVQRGIS